MILTHTEREPEDLNPGKEKEDEEGEAGPSIAQAGSTIHPLRPIYTRLSVTATYGPRMRL